MIKKLQKFPTKKNPAKFNFFQKLLLLLSFIIIGFTVLPIVVVLFIGLLPTITAIIVDTKNINRITTVGCFNISGVLICFHDIYKQITSEYSFSIPANIENIIIMLCSAAVGVFLYYILPDIFVFIFKNSSQHRLKVINAKLEKLSQNWSNIMPEDN